MNKGYVAALVLACALCDQTSARTYSSYTIGNSLSWDSQPDGIAAIAASQGIVLNDGYHIRASETLVYIEDNPNDVTLTNSYGIYSTALPNDAWNFISVQPFPDYSGNTSTLGTDLSAIEFFIAMASSGPSSKPRFYIYEGWPPTPCWCYPALPGEEYSQWWDAPSTNAPTTPTYLTEQYFYELFSDAAAANSNVSIYLIPVGEVMAQIDQDIRGGQFPEFTTIYDLYRDDYHLSYDVGRFVAATTVYATYFGRSPVGIAVPAGYFTVDGTATGAPGLLTQNTALRDRLEQEVWNVVSNDFRTGVAVQPAVTVTSQGEAGSGGSTLSVTPGGPGPFTYQWYQGVSGDTSKPVGNGAATLAVSALGSSASYWVQITSAIGIIENSATVTPNGTITGAPASNTDAPLPIWGLGALGVGLIMIASRRAN